MNDTIELQGTKKRIANYIASEFALSEDIRKSNEFIEYVSCFIDILENNYDTLISDDEDFQKDVPRNFSTNYGIVSPKANYFISINKITYIFVLAIAKNIISKYTSNIGIISNLVFELISSKDMPLFKKLDKALGESCVVLESAKNKTNGIDDCYYEKFQGECINNNLKCNFNENGNCTCNRNKIQKICDSLCNEHILTKKSGRYFYIDYL